VEQAAQLSACSSRLLALALFSRSHPMTAQAMVPVNPKKTKYPIHGCIISPLKLPVKLLAQSSQPSLGFSFSGAVQNGDYNG
jgi:hypothetical protein